MNLSCLAPQRVNFLSLGLPSYSGDPSFRWLSQQWFWLPSNCQLQPSLNNNSTQTLCISVPSIFLKDYLILWKIKHHKNTAFQYMFPPPPKLADNHVILKWNWELQILSGYKHKCGWLKYNYIHLYIMRPSACEPWNGHFYSCVYSKSKICDGFSYCSWMLISHSIVLQKKKQKSISSYLLKAEMDGMNLN